MLIATLEGKLPIEFSSNGEQWRGKLKNTGILVRIEPTGFASRLLVTCSVQRVKSDCSLFDASASVLGCRILVARMRNLVPALNTRQKQAFFAIYDTVFPDTASLRK